MPITSGMLDTMTRNSAVIFTQHQTLGTRVIRSIFTCLLLPHHRKWVLLFGATVFSKSQLWRIRPFTNGCLYNNYYIDNFRASTQSFSEGELKGLARLALFSIAKASTQGAVYYYNDGLIDQVIGPSGAASFCEGHTGLWRFTVNCPALQTELLVISKALCVCVCFVYIG